MFLWNIAVTSLAEVWIEMHLQEYWQGLRRVTSLAEVWIEIDDTGSTDHPVRSLPLRKCGLKYPRGRLKRLWGSHFPCGSVDWNNGNITEKSDATVTSLAEVWIEMCKWIRSDKSDGVTSLAEVWIEIDRDYWPYIGWCVTSLAEVWIEIE